MCLLEEIHYVDGLVQERRKSRVLAMKTHVHGLFDTDLHEVSWYFATLEADEAEWVLSSTDRVKISVKEPIQNGFLFLSHTKKANTATKFSQNGLENRQIVLVDRQDCTLFWCALSGPHNWTVCDWSRAWPTMAWLAKLLGVAVSSSIRNTIFSHTLKPWNSQVWDHISLTKPMIFSTHTYRWSVEQHACTYNSVLPPMIYHQLSNVRHTKSQNLNVSRLV